MRKLSKTFPVLWFICGLAFASACVVGYRQLQRSADNAKQLTHQIQSNKQSQQQAKSKNDQGNFDPNQIKPVTPSAYADAQLHYEELVNRSGIGSLFIPNAEIQTKILAGMSNQNLMVAVGTYYPDQQLGKGNYVLLAHNLVEGGGVLGRLPKTKLGQVIYATDFATIYEYRAIKNEIVDQSSGQLLDQSAENEPAILTLFRCEGGVNTPNRALLQGEFVRRYPASEASTDVKIGLGLGVMTEQGKPVETSDRFAESQDATLSTASEKAQEKQFKQEKPTYSRIEKLGIRCFSVISQYPVLIAVGFLVILIFLQRLAKKLV